MILQRFRVSPKVLAISALILSGILLVVALRLSYEIYHSFQAGHSEDSPSGIDAGGAAIPTDADSRQAPNSPLSEPSATSSPFPVGIDDRGEGLSLSATEKAVLPSGDKEAGQGADPAPIVERGYPAEDAKRALDAHEAMIQRLDKVFAEYGQRLRDVEERIGKVSSSPVQAPAPKSKKKLAKNRVPPGVSQLAELKRRRPAQAETPSSFSVESVDTWNGEKRVVLRDGAGGFVDRKIGDIHSGWRIEATDGQSVTLRGPKGQERRIDAEGASP